jgi:hypothetical protein
MRELAYKNKVDKCTNLFSSFWLFSVFFLSPLVIGGGLKTIFSNPATLPPNKTTRHIIINITLRLVFILTLPLNFTTDYLPYDA